jgi:hypothetical protein
LADDRRVRSANLALTFLVELAAIAAFAYWGATSGGSAQSVLLGILAPAVVVALWAVLAAPRSERRLPLAARVPFELAVFALAAVALLAADRAGLAAAFAAVAAVNAVLLLAFDQLDA